MQKVRLGMVGCGFAARDLYGPYLHYIEKGEVVAAMDVDPKRVDEYQCLTGCDRTYTELGTMPGPRPRRGPTIGIGSQAGAVSCRRMALTPLTSAAGGWEMCRRSAERCYWLRAIGWRTTTWAWW